MYVNGYLLAIPESNKDAYREMAEKWWDIAKDFGAIEHVEAWEAHVPDGEQADFHRAVQCKEGEKVVFSWVIWPDNDDADAGEMKMTTDPRFAKLGGTPLFDAKRMVYGGFEPLVWEGRK